MPVAYEGSWTNKHPKHVRILMVNRILGGGKIQQMIMNPMTTAKKSPTPTKNSELNMKHLTKRTLRSSTHFTWAFSSSGLGFTFHRHLASIKWSLHKKYPRFTHLISVHWISRMQFSLLNRKDSRSAPHKTVVANLLPATVILGKFHEN